MDILKSIILGREGLDRVRERYPALTKALEALDITDSDANSQGDLARLLEVVIQQIRQHQNKKWGVKRREWTAEGPKRSRYWGMRVPAHWIDHPYKEHQVWQDGSPPTTYVSEPYRIDGEGIKHLARLVDKGWDVRITAWRATWYPGHTLHVAVRPPKTDQKRNLAADILDTCESPRLKQMEEIQPG
jgi:hypothetical protein